MVCLILVLQYQVKYDIIQNKSKGYSMAALTQEEISKLIAGLGLTHTVDDTTQSGANAFFFGQNKNIVDSKGVKIGDTQKGSMFDSDFSKGIGGAISIGMDINNINNARKMYNLQKQKVENDLTKSKYSYNTTASAMNNAISDKEARAKAAGFTSPKYERAAKWA